MLSGAKHLLYLLSIMYSRRFAPLSMTDSLYTQPARKVEAPVQAFDASTKRTKTVVTDGCYDASLSRRCCATLRWL
jgi:hypothetical protein